MIDSIRKSREVPFRKAEAFETNDELFLVEDAQDNVFAEDRGKRRNTDINGLAVHGHRGLAILWKPRFGNVQVSHDLDARIDGALQFFGNVRPLFENTVDSISHPNEILFGLEVNVGRAFGDARQDQQVDQLDDRRNQTQVLAAFGAALCFGLANCVFDEIFEVADLTDCTVVLVDGREDIELRRCDDVDIEA